MKNEEFKLLLEDLHRRRIPGGIKKAVQILLDKKAEKITVLKLKGLSEMTDYLIICCGNSARQNNALADAVQDTLKKELNLQPLGSGRQDGGGMDTGRLRRFHHQHFFRRVAEEVCPGKAVDGCQTIRFFP